jgi:hypothetical protein
VNLLWPFTDAHLPRSALKVAVLWRFKVDFCHFLAKNSQNPHVARLKVADFMPVEFGTEWSLHWYVRESILAEAVPS